MSIWFFSDPHVGVNRSSHTTNASRERLREAVFQAAMGAVGVAGGDDPVYCLGDLFDTDTNSEVTILQGHQIARECDRVLGGNHDLPNREGKLSSLQLLDQTMPGSPIVVGGSEPHFVCDVLPEGMSVLMVPHMLTQELFEQSLLASLTIAKTHRRVRILCLHCNYDSGFIQNDASLNLSKEDAEFLLETFDYILLGHEHMPRTELDGRLIILGNTHPSSFADISDKFIWEFDGERFHRHMIWGLDKGYQRIKWDDLLDAEISAQFVDVVGSATAAEMPTIAAAISNLWKSSPHLLMVRNNVECIESTSATPVSATRALDIPTRVAAALDGTDLRPVWDSYLEKVQ